MQAIGHYWFDVLIAIVAVSGLLYGRKRGLSVELIPALQWIAIVIACGSLYKELGNPLASWMGIQPNLGYVVSYLGIGAVLLGIFSAIKGTVGLKLAGAHVFGKAEFPLGAIAGAVHFCCVLFVGLALLCSAYVPEEELTEPPSPYAEKPDLKTTFSAANIQRGVFYQARSGRVLKANLGQWLIAAQPPVQIEVKKIEGLGRKMEKAIEEDLTTEKK